MADGLRGLSDAGRLHGAGGRALGGGDARAFRRAAAHPRRLGGAGELPAASGEDSQAQEAAGRPEARPVQDPEALTAALEGCVAFGEGEAGVSLKTAIAAADLLNWAEANARDSSIDAMTAHLSAWLAEQDAERQALFWANWPAVDEQAWAMVRDLPGQLPLLADAGDPQRYDRYTPACYERLHCAVEKYLEAD